MREYVFVLEYERGIHPVRDAFIDNPDVVASALDITCSLNGGWRVERLTGPEQALETVENAYFDDQCNECTYPTPDCDAQFEYKVLEQEPTARTIYRYVTDQSYCSGVSYLAVKALGEGLVFGATQKGPFYEWRILVPDEENVEAFHEELQTGLSEGVTLDLHRIGTPDRWLRDRRQHHGTDIPYKHRQAVETAIAMGYYEHPREADLEDIATELDLPLTTLRYRLRRGESWATKTAIGGPQLATADPEKSKSTGYTPVLNRATDGASAE